MFEITGTGQINKVDSFILNIDNSQLFGTCHYAWFLEMKSSAGDSLIKIGKEATLKLVPLLDDDKKGIIVHYLLSNIWSDSLIFSATFSHIEKDSISDYCYAGLNFYDKNGYIYAQSDVLKNNKKRWLQRINK